MVKREQGTLKFFILRFLVYLFLGFFALNTFKYSFISASLVVYFPLFVGKIKIELNKKNVSCQKSPIGSWGGMEMKKVMGVMLVLLCVFSVYMMSTSYYGSSVLKNCFDKTGAEFIRMDIEGTGKIETDGTCKATAEKLFNASGLIGEYKIDEEYNAATLELYNKTVHMVIKTKKMQSKNLIYASVILSQYNDDVNITNIRRSISRAFSIYNIKPSFSSLILGKYNEFLSISQMKERAAKAFSTNNARFVEGVDDGNMVSVSGYISGIGDKISYMGKLVNLNTALRYSRTDGCTYIWVGSPIILLEY